MGNFYTNVTVRGPHQAEVVAAVEELGFRAFVAATVSGLTVVCEEQSDAQDETVWRDVSRQLSSKLKCPALAVMNYDDDILAYALHQGGALLDEYNSCPDYWSEADESTPPLGGDARILCGSFGMPGNPAEVERILRATENGTDEDGSEDIFVFELERHAALLKALGWPDLPYAQGFTTIVQEGASPGWRAVG